MKYSIRKATTDDVESIRFLFYETVMAVDKTHYTQLQLQKWLAVYTDENRWKYKLSKDYYLVAINKMGKLIGFCSLQNNGCIDMLYTHPLYQNQGIARDLLHAIYDMADEKQITTLFTNTSLAATSFFEKNGFLVQKVANKTLDGVCFTQIMMDKRLWVV